MSRFALHRRAVACAVGIALLAAYGNPAFAQLDSNSNSEIDPNTIGIDFDKSQPAPEIDARFRPQQGWIGGDSGHSVDLGHQRTLWLYGDTWVGAVKDGRRSKARIVHNSVGMQCGSDAPCSFVVREDEQHKSVDLIKPADGRGWLWFQAGAMANGRLYLFMSQFDRSANGGHTHIAQWLGIVSNPLEDPREWCLDQIQIPYSLFSDDRQLTFGTSVIVSGEHLYIYGSEEHLRGGSQKHYLVLARVPLNEIGNMEAWTFHRRGRWSHDYTRPSRLADYMAGETSIVAVPNMNQFVMVYTDCGVSQRIVARTAPTPAGPWSDIQVVHSCRESSLDRNLFSYGGKAHPALSSDGKLVISYLTSSVNTWQVATDARLYWPKFLTVEIKDARPAQSIGTVAQTASTRGQLNKQGGQ